MEQNREIKYIERDIGGGKKMRFRECTKCHKFTVPERSFLATCPKCRGKDESYYYNR
jgi:Zn finger protein HypA/HybF involved in hydrogenase expression